MMGGRPFGVRTTRRSILCVCIMAGSVLLSHANDTKHTAGQTRAAAPASATEARICAPCHAGVVKSFAQTRHGHALVTGKAKELTCETCHGSRKAHVESGGSTSGIADPASGTAAQVDVQCLRCHAGKHASFARSPHGRSNVGCTSCHSIHAAAELRYLLRANEPELCYDCHAEIKLQFSLPSRHKVDKGLVLCTDCHDVHGTRQEELPGTAHRQDAFCTDCHTATAGPFVFEHAIMQTEGCTACHFPHGGPNPHLLVRANTDVICRTCHSPAPDLRSGAHMQAAKDDEQSKPCTECHTDIHGSNSSRTFRRNQ